MMDEKENIKTPKNIVVTVFIISMVVATGSLAHGCYFGGNIINFFLFIGSGMIAYSCILELRARRNQTNE